MNQGPLEEGGLFSAGSRYAENALECIKGGEQRTALKLFIVGEGIGLVSWQACLSEACNLSSRRMMSLNNQMLLNVAHQRLSI